MPEAVAAATARRHRLLLKETGDPDEVSGRSAAVSVLHRQGRRGQDLHRVCHRDHPGPPGQEGAAGQHRPGVQRRAGLRTDASATSSPRSPPSTGLSALEIDPEQAADAYRERIVGPVRGLLPDAGGGSITEQLSGSCTTEIASFNEFTELLTDSDGEVGQRSTTCCSTPHPPGTPFGCCNCRARGPISSTTAKATRPAWGRCPAWRNNAPSTPRGGRVGDPQRTRLVLVARAQKSTLAEIARTHRELAAIGLTRQHVVINGVLPAPADDTDPLSAAIYQREQQAIASLPDELRACQWIRSNSSPPTSSAWTPWRRCSPRTRRPDERQTIALDVDATPRWRP